MVRVGPGRRALGFCSWPTCWTMCLCTRTWPLTLSVWLSLDGVGEALSSWGTWSELKRGLLRPLLCSLLQGRGWG